MAEPKPGLDAAAMAALEQLADVVLPAPVSWLPQTWGWAIVALLLLAAAVWALLRWRRYRAANRYRVEVLAELARLEAQLADDSTRGRALAGIPALLKRTALAAWPRSETASLSGAQWVAFLRRQAEFPEAAARLLDDAEYRPAQALDAVSADDARGCARVARQWIESHRVPA